MNQELEELKAANEQLRSRLNEIETRNGAASEGLHKRIIETTSQGYWLISPQLETIDVNQALCDMLGWTRQELIGRSILGFYDEENRKLLRASMATIFDKERPPYEVALRRKNGEEVRCLFNVATLFDEAGEITGSFALASDITDRRKAEEAVLESQRRLEDIINFLPDATLVIDAEGKVTHWNRAVEEMTGVKAHDMIGRGNYDYAIPFYGEVRPILIDLVLSPNEVLERGYNNLLRREKSFMAVETMLPIIGRYVFAVAAPIYDTNGETIGAIESIRDITDRRKAGEAVLESQRRLEDIINFLPDATLVIDAEGKVTHWNRAVEEMTG
ncbi:MAG: PAS domain-containing protein, partial [Ferrimicrobium sp.]